MTSRRLYAPVVLTLLACGGLAFFAASRTWVEATVRAKGLPPDTVAVSGTDAQPLVPALALVVVTGALAVLAASVRIRWLVGVLMVVVGFGAAIFVATNGASLDGAFDDAVQGSTAFTGENAPDARHVVVWPVLAGAAFVLAGLSGADRRPAGRHVADDGKPVRVARRPGRHRGRSLGGTRRRTRSDRVG